MCGASLSSLGRPILSERQCRSEKLTDGEDCPHLFFDVTCCTTVGKETPDNLRIKINLSIGSTALVLLGSDNSTELLRAGLDGLKSIVHMYPETLEVLAAVQVSWQPCF